MAKVIAAAFWLIILSLGVAWALSTAYAELSCPWLFPSILGTCPAGNGLVWMTPMFTAPLGLPFFIAGLILALLALVPRRKL